MRLLHARIRRSIQRQVRKGAFPVRVAGNEVSYQLNPRGALYEDPRLGTGVRTAAPLVVAQGSPYALGLVFDETLAVKGGRLISKPTADKVFVSRGVSVADALETAGADVTALDARVTTAEGELVTLDTRADALETEDISLDARLDTAEADIAAVETDVAARIPLTQKGAVSGVATLDGSSKVPVAQVSEVLGIKDLSDVTATTGTGTTVVMTGSPTITTPNIASMANATHNHQNAAGGGTLAKAALTSWPSDYASQANAGTSPWEIWYCANNVTGVTGPAATVVLNTLYAVPFVPAERGGTLDQIAIEVTTLGVGSARLGIYSATSATNLYPSALVLDCGTVSVAATGKQAATISQALTPGTLYWLVCVFDVACNIRGLSNNQHSNILGYPNTLGASSNWGATVAFTYAALANPFPNSAALVAVVPRPAIFVRYSA